MRIGHHENCGLCHAAVCEHTIKAMQESLMSFGDLKDPDDPSGRTIREVNREKTHAIPIGTLVELEDGVRLFVVKHNRDCDGTPLYCLGPDPEDLEPRYPGFAMNSGWVSGYSEDALEEVSKVSVTDWEGDVHTALREALHSGKGYHSCETPIDKWCQKHQDNDLCAKSCGCGAASLWGTLSSVVWQALKHGRD
jgi:hypothetical protein